MINTPLYFSPVTGEKANDFIPIFSPIIGEIQRGKISRITIVDELVKSPEFVILRKCNDRRISAVVLGISTVLSTLQLFEIPRFAVHRFSYRDFQLHSYLIQNDILLFLILITSLPLLV